MTRAVIAVVVFLTSTLAVRVVPHQLPREQWGAPAVTVVQKEGRWVIAGRTTTVTLSADDLRLQIQSGRASWNAGGTTVTVDWNTQSVTVR
jgi:hypothetical protein